MAGREAAEPIGWAERAADRSPSVQRSRVRSVEQARRIVAAAKVLVADRGASFTIQELVKEAGVALKTFYRYFEGKDQLLLAMLEEEIVDGCEQLRAATASLPGPVERLHAYVDWIVTAMHDGSDQWRQFVTSEHFRLQQVLPHDLARVNAAFADLLVPEIEAGQRAGTIAPGDAARAAWFVEQLVMAVFHHYAFAGPPPADIGESLWETCRRTLGVIQP
jgi:AcrR family transcriptional regulator